jgi:hypothetical protein
MKSQSGIRAIIGIILLAALICIPNASLAGSLEPSSPPTAGTMKTLDEIPPTWSQKLPAAQRFVIVLDGAAVLDKETGLVWEKSPDTTPIKWYDAVTYCYNKTVGGRKGWRLPMVEELASLIDTTQTNPALPSGHPFINVQSGLYWLCTGIASNPTYAYLVDLSNGLVSNGDNDPYHYVWAVRGGL